VDVSEQAALIHARGLTMLGSVGWHQLVKVAYLVVMGLIGVQIAGRRVHRLLLT
jgi:hypothetical protein